MPQDTEINDYFSSHVSPDLVSAILSFEAEELAQTGRLSEDVLLEKACELWNWSLTGQHPRFVINHWVEVLVMGARQAHCRILNSRTHLSLRPLTFDNLHKTVLNLLQKVEAHITAPHFEELLLAAYEDLSDNGPEVKLHDLFLWLQARQPQYQREDFGLDLFYVLENGLLAERTPSLLTGQALKKELYHLPDPNGVQIVHRLLLQATGSLQSLDI